MSIPYRARRNLRRIAVTVLALVLFTTLALLGWLLWLNRYVVYSREGARFDFGISLEYGPGVIPSAPAPLPTITLHDKQEDVEDPEQPVTKELQQFSGFHVTLDNLKDPDSFEATRNALAALPKGSTVMLELKSVSSYVYYTSDVAREDPDFDVVRMDTLIRDLQSQGHYVIARIPAFQERHYILEDEHGRFDQGLEHISGGSLWWDGDNRCYWLNPASDGTMTYLIQLVTELRSLGFDEVVFDNFRFPDTDKIQFEGDQMETLNNVASMLVKTCSTDKFCVSFTRSAPDLSLPEGRTRLYLTGISAADADTAAAASGLADPKAQVVFLTEKSDTRYEVFSVLRPLDTAH